MITGINRGQQRRLKRDSARFELAVSMHRQFPKAFGLPRYLVAPGGRLGKLLKEGAIDIKKTVMKVAS